MHGVALPSILMPSIMLPQCPSEWLGSYIFTHTRSLPHRDLSLNQGMGGQFTHFYPGTLHAIDLECPVGTPVLSLASGIVREIRQSHAAGGIHARGLFSWNSVSVCCHLRAVFLPFTGSLTSCRHRGLVSVLTSSSIPMLTVRMVSFVLCLLALHRFPEESLGIHAVATVFPLLPAAERSHMFGGTTPVHCIF